MSKIKSLLLLYIFTLIFAATCSAQHANPGSVPAAPVNFLNGKTSTQIPFTRYKGWIILKVKVNGQQERSFLFDTGAPINILRNVEDADPLKLKTQGEIRVNGGDHGKPVSVPLAVNVKFNVGDLEITDALMAVGMAKDVLTGLDGIIGKCLFENTIVHIDWAKSIMTISDRQGYEFSKTDTALPITVLRTGHFATDITVENRGKTISTKAIVDFGNRSSFFIDRSIATEIIDETKLIKDVITGWGATGPVIGDVGRASVGISNIRVANIPTSFRGEMSFGREGAYANIGLSVLDKFDVLLDYSGRKMILRPNKTLGDAVLYNQSGIIVGPKRDGDHLLVADIIPQSPAFEAGMQKGDKIISVNGIGIREKTVVDAENLVAGKGTQDIQLVIERNGKGTTTKIKARRLI